MTLKRLLPLLAAVATAVASLAAWRELDWPEHGIDDAQIFFTYAQNLAGGEGFVYNPGGERVEGFSSLLWVLICAAAMRLSDNPEPLLQLVSVLLVALAIASAVRFVVCAAMPTAERPRATETAVWSAILVIAWCCSSAGFIVWSTVTLMDTGLWCAVLTIGTLAFAGASITEPTRRQSIGLSLAVAVLLVTRPEATAIGAVWLAASLVAQRLARREPATILRSLVPPAVTYLVTLAALVSFRLAYFGYPLPNTYYAKVSPDTVYNLSVGIKYLAHFAVDQPLAATLVALGIVVWTAAVICYFRRNISETVADTDLLAKQLVISSTVLAALAIPVLAGGDHFVLYRFFQPVWPLIVLPAVLLGIQCSRSTAPAVATWPNWQRAVSVVLLALISAGQVRDWRALRTEESLLPEFGIARDNLMLGKTLNDAFAATELPSIGVVTAGGVARSYRGEVIDLMGLNLVAMGHSPGERRGFKNHAAFDPQVFYLLSPDLVAPAKMTYAEATAQFLKPPRPWLHSVFRGLLDEPKFREEYVPVIFGGPDSGTLVIAAYCKRSLLEQYERAGMRFTQLSQPPQADGPLPLEPGDK